MIKKLPIVAILQLAVLSIQSSLSPAILAHTERPDLKVSQTHLDQYYFKKDMYFGFATAAFQNDAEEHSLGSNWDEWQKSSWPDGTPHIEGGQRKGKSCDQWNQYKEDIRLMKEDFNANAWRFSVAWDQIEPVEGQFNKKALDYYSELVDECLQAGITPMITFHHFVHPEWFEKLGGFEKEENIKYFVRFCQVVFAKLSDRVRVWFTINEPSIYVFQGYLPLNCVFPPGKPSWKLGVKVLRNLMQAHTEVYLALKGMPHGIESQIGLVHQYLKFYSYTWYNPIEKMPGMLVNELLNDTILTFLKTGKFEASSPDGVWAREEYVAPAGPISDFVGLNYYSRAVIKMLWGVPPKMIGSCYDGETMTSMPYAIYPAGMYNAIKIFAETGLPVWITENGMADTNNDEKLREQWNAEYLKAISLAIEDGYDVRAYLKWTLTDNFEWNMGYNAPFGAYSVDRATQKRTLKEGEKIYASIIKKSRAGLLSKHTEDHIETH